MRGLLEILNDLSKFVINELTSGVADGIAVGGKLLAGHLEFQGFGSPKVDCLQGALASALPPNDQIALLADSCWSLQGALGGGISG